MAAIVERASVVKTGGADHAARVVHRPDGSVLGRLINVAGSPADVIATWGVAVGLANDARHAGARSLQGGKKRLKPAGETRVDANPYVVRRRHPNCAVPASYPALRFRFPFGGVAPDRPFLLPRLYRRPLSFVGIGVQADALAPMAGSLTMVAR